MKIAFYTLGCKVNQYDTEAMAILKDTRETARQILVDFWDRPAEALAALLLWGYQAQEALDGEKLREYDKKALLDLGTDLVKRSGFGEQKGGFAHAEGCFHGLGCLYSGLEILTDQWRERLAGAKAPAPMTDRVLPLARYFVDRYWLQAVSDYDLYCRVKFMVVSCILVSGLGGDFLETAQLYSKEIENDIDNVEALLDAAYSHPALTDDKVLGMLLEL